MDPAAVLVAMLVFLVFGFLFGNIALCVVFLMSSLLLSLREYSSHTRAFVSTDTNCSSRALLSNFPIFNRYSYAQKKYNPDGAKKPKKKIGAKKKKMLLMKSGMRRPE
jgi:hypothetical protein